MIAASAPGRVTALDGLRGWASLSVIVYHMSWETFGTAFPVFRTFPAALVGNGNFAVALFLMVSGYVLTVRGWRSDDKAAVRRSIVKRYFRLTLPILVSVLIFWAVIELGLVFSLEAGRIVSRPDWLVNFGHLEPDLLDAVLFGLIIVYIKTTAWSYGPFLWTMTAELWGSYLVLTLCLFELPRRWSYLSLGVLTVVGLFTPFRPYLPMAACYPAGALVALMVRDGLIGSEPPSQTESWVATIVFAASFVAAAIAEVAYSDLSVTTTLAMVTFVAAMRSGPISRFLSLSVSQWLGRLSFPLYLMQIVVLVSLTSWLIVTLHANNALTVWAALSIALVSVVACLAAAWLFMPVERAALRLSGWIGEKAVPRLSRA